jgi:hypothetical protein
MMIIEWPGEWKRGLVGWNDVGMRAHGLDWWWDFDVGEGSERSKVIGIVLGWRDLQVFGRMKRSSWGAKDCIYPERAICCFPCME